MSKELNVIKNILDRLAADEESEILKTAFKNQSITNSFVVYGVCEAGGLLKKNFLNLVDTLGVEDDLESIECKKMTNREILLASRCAYRELALSVHHTLTKKAVNFSINNLAVRGLTERAKEIMRIVWWCDSQIEKILKDIKLNPEDDDGNYLKSQSGEVVEIKVINNSMRY